MSTPWTRYKAGQNLRCTVTEAQPGGYEVTLGADKLPGFLPTELRLRAGQKIIAGFVCVSNGRLLLSPRFGFHNGGGGEDGQGSGVPRRPKPVDGRSSLALELPLRNPNH